MVMREKLLADTLHESVNLSKGYWICILDRAVWDCYFMATNLERFLKWLAKDW